jgi:DsbC/DsbD-like thiol-disulfide interchange protein
MVASKLPQLLWPLVVGAVVVAASERIAGAADASAWNGDIRSAVRLVAARSDRGGELRAGIELRLAAGWKTYWRYPGDSGVPPAFDFAKSGNVKSIEVHWPGPHRFTDETGSSIGYKDGVLLPLRVVAQDPRRPVVLRLALDYAICERLCIPAKGTASLELTRSATSNEAAMAAAEAKVPQPVPFGDLGRFAIRAMEKQEGPKPRIVVDVAAPAGVPLDLFVEGPSSDWALPLPDPIEGAPAGLTRFAFDLDGLPPGVAATGARLRLTLVAGERAIEASAPPLR